MKKHEEYEDEEFEGGILYPTLEQIEKVEKQAQKSRKQGREEKRYSSWKFEEHEDFYTPPRYLPPPPSEPKKIHLVVWDLDDTLWSVTDKNTGHRTIITSCGLSPYRGIDNDTIENTKCIVHLKTGVRETLSGLKKMGIRLSIASINNYEQGYHALSSFGLAPLFDDIQINWNRKDIMIQDTLNKLRNEHICIADNEIMFLDDRDHNLLDAYDKFKGIVLLNSAEDYQDAREIFKYIKR